MRGNYVNNTIESILVNNNSENLLSLITLVVTLIQKNCELEIDKKNLSEENSILKEEITCLKNIKSDKCIYPIYQVVDTINEFLKLSFDLDFNLKEKDILEIIQNTEINGNNYIEYIYVKKDDESPTPFISLLCITKIIDYLKSYISKLDNSIDELSLERPDNFDEVVKQIEEKYSYEDIFK